MYEVIFTKMHKFKEGGKKRDKGEKYSSVYNDADALLGSYRQRYIRALY